jgi:hypothetical protein
MGNELPSNDQLFFPANNFIWLDLFSSPQAILSALAEPNLVASKFQSP